MSDELLPRTFYEDEIRDAFLRWIWGTTFRPNPDDDGSAGMHYLIDYVEKWLDFSGDDYSGVEMAAGSYESFLVAILRIVEAWIEDPRILDGKDPAPVGKPFQRALKGIFHPNHKLGMSALKYEFDWKKFQLLKKSDD